MQGKVKNIFIAAQSGAKLEPHTTIEVHAGKGIVGDRYYAPQGSIAKSEEENLDFEITLIEQEQIDKFNTSTGFNYSGADFRRNIITTGIQLNELEGQTFSIGKLEFRGIRLCEPCATLSGLLGQEVLLHMVNKAGLRAQITNNGFVNVDDIITQTP